MKGSLRAKFGSSVYQLSNPVTTVGREGSDIILQLPNVERQHATLTYDDSQGCYVLEDLNSANGTYVNEMRVQNAAVRLAPGDVIRFGYGNPGYELNVDQIPLIQYPSVAPPTRPWLRVMSSSSQNNSTSLPYIPTALSSFVDDVPVYQNSPCFSLPASSLSPGDVRGGVQGTGGSGGVMPHPPLRSRPASAGSSRTRPSPGFPARVGWMEDQVAGKPVNGEVACAEEMGERLLRMGDELSRLASYEAECHRKDGVINSLRDEIADLKASRANTGFRAGGEMSAFSNTGIVTELRQQCSELQILLKEKDEAHRTVTQKLADYQGQLHIKNEELASLQKQLNAQSMPTTKIIDESNHKTNTLASLRTEMAEKDRKIAHLSHDLTKTNKAKTQTATLMNTLQRENAAKDGMNHQLKTEVDKLKKQLREKDATISTLSAKLTRQKAIKEAEFEADKREKELISSVGKLQTTEKQLKERARQVAELQSELDRIKQAFSEGRQFIHADTTCELVDTSHSEDFSVDSECSVGDTGGPSLLDSNTTGNPSPTIDSTTGSTYLNQSAESTGNTVNNVLEFLTEQLEQDTIRDRELRQQLEKEREKEEKIKSLIRSEAIDIGCRGAASSQHRSERSRVNEDGNREKATCNPRAVEINSETTEGASRECVASEVDQMYGLALAFAKNDRAIQQELDHAKAQFLDANRAEKLLKVDYQQLEKRFDRFRRKVIQNSYINNQRKLADKELDDEELLDHIKELSQDNVKLVDEIRGYAEAEEKQQNERSDLKDAMGVLRKTLEGMERHLSRSGHGYKSIEKELTELEEFHTHDSLYWIKEVLCRLLSSEMTWQKRAEDTLRRAGVDSDTSDTEEAPTVEDLCRQLRSQRDKCRQLQAKITEMEEMHQDTILKLREDAKREEERQVARAVAELRTEQEEKRHKLMQEMRMKEQERIREAVEMERRVMESQQGSVTQLQQALSEKQAELESYRSALGTAKTQYEQAKEELQHTKEGEYNLKVQLQEVLTNHQTQVKKLEREKEEFKNYKQDEVASFKEQTRQHSLTIVAMEERLLRLTKQNKQLEQEVAYHKQQTTVRYRPSSPRKDTSRPSSPKKLTSPRSPRPQSPKKEPKQTRSVETETVPLTSVEASLQSDVYKLEQLVLLLRREASQAKKEALDQSDVVQSLRRDLAGASARMSDMTGELSDIQKQKLEEYEERIKHQDKELDVQKHQLLKLSALVDEQQKEIDLREGKLSEQHRSLVKQKQEHVKKGTELVKFQRHLENTIEDQEAKIEEIENDKKVATDLYALGVRCRGERHDQVILRQKEALSDMRQKAKVMEQLKPPLPSHEQSLTQIVALKKELSELRGSIAAREEDFHKSESQIHSESSRQAVIGEDLDRQLEGEQDGDTYIETRQVTLHRTISRRGVGSSSNQLRIAREQSSSNLAEKDFEKSTHKDTKESLDLSEKTYLKLARTLGALLEVEPIPGCRSMAHIPAEEREKLEQDRTKAVEMMVSRVRKLQERLERKEHLLGGYENDLVNLRESQTVAGMKSAEATGLKIDVRSRQEEIVYLRESLSRLRDELDQQRRLNVSLRERKKFAMDYEDRDTHRKGHSCYVDENTRYQEEAKKRKAAEKARRKNYEIESLKKELRSADRELNDTAIRLQAFESTRNFRSTQSEDTEEMEYT